MSKDKTHDLFHFMQQVSVEMSAEYERIRMRANEDPGTAGDEGEENWAELLRDWLPRTYQVVTKGRIINHEGATSPQIDVLVLHGSYPKKLLNKKLYLDVGVAAAFECKTTLKASHIKEATENCVSIKRLCEQRSGTPYCELRAPIFYGLLSHSHQWKGTNSTPSENIEDKLYGEDERQVTHPREQLDLLCVSDLATWTSSIVIMTPGVTSSGYMRHSHEKSDQFTPIGVFIAYLVRRLGWEDPALRPLAGYYQIVNRNDRGSGRPRMWDNGIFSESIRSRVDSLPYNIGITW